MTTRYKSESDIIGLLQRQISDLSAGLVSDILPEPWRAIGTTNNPAFANSWGNYGSGYAVAAFRREHHGIVRLRGMISGGTIGQIAFTLPVGYRPDATLVFGTVSNNAIGRIDIATSGTINPSAGSSAWISLNGITFVIA